MLNVKIYQINTDRDEKNMAFMRYDSLEKFQGTSEINSSIYDKVWEGSIDGSSLEDVYTTFNYEHPDDYRGRSLSVSDVVEITDAPKRGGKIDYLKSGMSSVYTDLLDYIQAQDRLREEDIDFEAHDYTGLSVPVMENGFYFCDSVGFKKVEFEPEKTQEFVPYEPDKIKVVLLNPGELAKVVEIDDTLAAKQKLVGGNIEVFAPFDEEVCVVCNDESKIAGLPLNRSFRDEQTGEVLDIVAGPCFICDGSSERLGSLSEDRLNKYVEKFRFPERFSKVNGSIVVTPYDPYKKQSFSDLLQSAQEKSSVDTSGSFDKKIEFDR